MPLMIRFLLEINWDHPLNRAFDWSLALLSLAGAVYLQSWLWAAAGVIGLGFAWYRPMSRIQKRFRSMIVRRGPVSPMSKG